MDPRLSEQVRAAVRSAALLEGSTTIPRCRARPRGPGHHSVLVQASTYWTVSSTNWPSNRPELVEALPRDRVASLWSGHCRHSAADIALVSQSDQTARVSLVLASASKENQHV